MINLSISNNSLSFIIQFSKHFPEDFLSLKKKLKTNITFFITEENEPRKFENLSEDKKLNVKGILRKNCKFLLTFCF